jgi:hypothetical protein
MIFSHGGKLGDLLAGLPTVRAMSRGNGLAEIIITKEHWGYSDGRTALNQLQRLLQAQDYIGNVAYQDKPAGGVIDLDRFRNHWWKGMNIADFHLSAFRLPHHERDRPWLAVEPIHAARVVFSRTSTKRRGDPCDAIAHDPDFPWQRIADTYRNEAVFMGLPSEHQDFCRLFGDVAYRQTWDLYEAAQVIAGAQLMIANSSAPLWLGLGLGKRCVQEVWSENPCCKFGHRPDDERLGGPSILPVLE